MNSESTETLSQILDIVLQIVVVILPFVLSWFLRNYVKGTTAEKEIAAIVKLANNAIDYVENEDNRGNLKVPPEVSKGIHKLGLASSWLESELNRTGVSITNEAAEKWIASEFQKRLGNVQMVGTTATLAKEAVTIIQDLTHRELIELTSEADKAASMIDYAADWLIARLAEKGAAISRETALTWVRSEFLKAIQIPDANLPPNEQLANLAKMAIEYIQTLKEQGRLTIHSGSGTRTVDKDVAMAWLLTEATKRELQVSTEQIVHSLELALEQ